MSSDLQTLFVNLAEKEKFKGHHSAEGRAIRTLSRALNGWSAGNLSDADVMVLCDQAMEDWLKSKLKLSAWSTPTLEQLVVMGVKNEWLTNAQAARLKRIRRARSRHHEQADKIYIRNVEAALEFCIQLVEKHW
jgi:hypothetical protein